MLTLLYFLVCDKPVSECKNWKSESFNRDDHCYAADKGQDYIYYKKLRENVKNGGSTTSSVTPPISFDSERQRREELRLLNAIGDGPFKPDHPLAASRSDMTKCRKCGYFSNLASYRNSEKPSGSDLCRACGRIASAKAFEKIKRRQYTPVANDILLGKKSITFTIHARDPSKTVECAKYWEEEKDNSRWVVDKKEMANDFFRHRIGKEPTLGLILNCIPVVNVESIPESGRRQRDYGNYDENESPPSVFETEALLLDNPKDLTLLRELYSFDSAGNNDLGQIITAKWNKSQGKGVSSKEVLIGCPSSWIKMFLTFLFQPRQLILKLTFEGNVLLTHITTQEQQMEEEQNFLSYLEFGMTYFHSSYQI